MNKSYIVFENTANHEKIQNLFTILILVINIESIEWPVVIEVYMNRTQDLNAYI